MKAFKIWLAVVVTACVISQGYGWAEMIQGEITYLDPVARSLGISRLDPASGTEVKFSIAVPQDAEFKGFESLEELKVGDEVEIDTYENEVSGALEANKVALEKG